MRSLRRSPHNPYPWSMLPWHDLGGLSLFLFGQNAIWLTFPEVWAPAPKTLLERKAASASVQSRVVSRPLHTLSSRIGVGMAQGNRGKILWAWKCTESLFFGNLAVQKSQRKTHCTQPVKRRDSLDFKESQLQIMSVAEQNISESRSSIYEHHLWRWAETWQVSCNSQRGSKLWVERDIYSECRAARPTASGMRTWSPRGFPEGGLGMG